MVEDPDELATILEGIGEGFYAVDRDWRIRRFNGEAARHFGRPAEEVLGRTLWDVFPGARETALGRLFVDTMAGRKPVTSEIQSVVIAGRWLAYRLFPLGDGMGVVFRDITDRKSAEEHRDLLIRELDLRVKEHARHGAARSPMSEAKSGAMHATGMTRRKVACASAKPIKLLSCGLHPHGPYCGAGFGFASLVSSTAHLKLDTRLGSPLPLYIGICG